MSRATLLALLLGLAACAGGSGPSVDAVEGASDGSHETSDAPSPEADLPAPLDAPSDALPGAHLEFVDAFGDDQKSCVDTDVCTYTVASANERSLRIRYLEGGAPAEGRTIAFEVIEDALGAGRLSAPLVFTDADGIAADRLRVAPPGQCAGGTFRVRVSVPDRPAVAPVFFEIHHGDKCDAYLSVSFTYDGLPLFDGVRVGLYRSSHPDVADVPCGGLDPFDLPEADVEGPVVQVSQTAKFSMLPGLEDEQEQRYAIVARGELMDGTPVAFGCNDTDGHVQIFSSRHVTLALEPLATVGNLRVQVEAGDDVTVPLHDVTVSLVYAQDLDCATYVPQNEPAPADVLARFVLADLASPALFQGLPTTASFAVTATARNPQGYLAASACADDVSVEPGVGTALEVTLHPIQ
jgi:hypothetical protein